MCVCVCVCVCVCKCHLILVISNLYKWADAAKTGDIIEVPKRLQHVKEYPDFMCGQVGLLSNYISFAKCSIKQANVSQSKTNLCSLFVINKFACCVLLQPCYPSTKALGEIYRLAKSFHFDPTIRDTVNKYIILIYI